MASLLGALLPFESKRERIEMIAVSGVRHSVSSLRDRGTRVYFDPTLIVFSLRKCLNYILCRVDITQYLGEMFELEIEHPCASMTPPISALFQSGRSGI